MILKVRQIPISKTYSEGYWSYYEAERFVFILGQYRKLSLNSNQQLVWDASDDSLVRSVNVPNGERLVFNTEAFLINETGKTVDHFFELVEPKSLKDQIVAHPGAEPHH